MNYAMDINHLSDQDEGILKAIDENYAVIQFTPKGEILGANKNFVDFMGYNLEEIANQHHRIFCDQQYSQSIEYKKFWNDLAEGKTQTGEFSRYTKDGSKVWLQASYTPIYNDNNEVIKIIKFAQDITDQKRQNLDYEGKIQAINKSQAVIEFEPDGTIIQANNNFLDAMGYSLNEIQGKHHKIFCDSEFVQSSQYQQMWIDLQNGQFKSGEFKRFNKTGKDIWIQATYNPICDENQKVVKIVKFAQDITDQKRQNLDYEGKIQAIDKSQAVIEFEPDGTIIQANNNFLDAMGYSLNEIQGKHHKIFCESEFINSPKYEQMWNELRDGKFQAGQYKRINKQGEDVWIQASYNPIIDDNGNTVRVVKYATDLTAEKKAYIDLVETFDKGAKEVSVSSNQLTTISANMLDSAESTRDKVNTVSVSSEEIAQGFINVASNIEEMTHSIQEISKSSSEASKISSDAKEKSEQANERISGLGIASKEIGNITKVISSIAEQTNLLALNATIEAARAGEAGKGFAVVANEVKELAKQTASATDNITQKIQDVQTNTDQVVNVITDISKIIDNLNSIASSTAASVEEQSATTKEVSRIISESNTGLEQVRDAINDVSQVAETNADGANQTKSSAEALTDLSIKLQDLVKQAKLR